MPTTRSAICHTTITTGNPGADETTKYGGQYDKKDLAAYDTVATWLRHDHIGLAQSAGSAYGPACLRMCDSSM